MSTASIRDLRSTIIPKSDQLNSEQLLYGPMTIKVLDVSITNDEQQPLLIHHDKDAKRPYKPCKTMRKLLILHWGEDGEKWIGQSMTLFCDSSVRFGGNDVGGIRISHMTGLSKTEQTSLTSTRGKKATHTVQPLVLADPELVEKAKRCSALGTAALQDFWKALSKQDRAVMLPMMPGLKSAAAEADAAMPTQAPEPDADGAIG